MKPIIFNTEMVRAILDNCKTVTRRVVKPQHLRVLDSPYHKEHPETLDKVLLEKLCIPPYQPGDILYVRETWYYESHMEDVIAGEPDLPSGRYSHCYIFKADCPDYPVNVGVGQHGWHPSIHMPREAARIFLRVTDVRVERLQDITEEQAQKEGAKDPNDYQSLEWYDRFPYLLDKYNIAAFAGFWDSILKPADRALYGWEANPWVWVIEFERISKAEVQQHV